jgi:hypothetical protein
MDALDLDLGDEVHVDGEPRPFTVTAEAFSLATGHTAYDAGAQTTAQAMQRLVPDDQDLKFHPYFVRFTPGTDVAVLRVLGLAGAETRSSPFSRRLTRLTSPATTAVAQG